MIFILYFILNLLNHFYYTIFSHFKLFTLWTLLNHLSKSSLPILSLIPSLSYTAIPTIKPYNVKPNGHVSSPINKIYNSKTIDLQILRLETLTNAHLSIAIIPYLFKQHVKSWDKPTNLLQKLNLSSQASNFFKKKFIKKQPIQKSLTPI